MTLWQRLLRVCPIPQTQEEVDRLTPGLGAGEQHAICLCLASRGLLVIDDQAGRKSASLLGIAITGVVGVLLVAKQKSHIPLVRPVVETIRRHGYWLSDTLVETAARLAGEP